MDLESIVPAPRKVPLQHPATEDEVGLTFTLKPATDPDVMAAEREWQNARLAKRKQTLTAEALDAYRLKVLLTAVEGWEFTNPEFTIGGEQPEFSPGRLKKILTQPKFRWIRNWLDAELGNEGSFFEGSEPSQTA